VEFDTVEAAQKALNYEGNIQISPTPTKAETSESDFIDPDVQSELDLMYPLGTRQTQSKPQGEFLIKKSQKLLNSVNFQQSKRSCEILSLSSSQECPQHHHDKKQSHFQCLLPILVSSARHETTSKISRRNRREVMRRSELIDYYF
jgi:hypothetical protein